MVILYKYIVYDEVPECAYGALLSFIFLSFNRFDKESRVWCLCALDEVWPPPQDI